MEIGDPKLRIKHGVHTGLDNRLGIVWSRFSNQ